MEWMKEFWSTMKLKLNGFCRRRMKEREQSDKLTCKETPKGSQATTETTTKKTGATKSKQRLRTTTKIKIPKNKKKFVWGVTNSILTKIRKDMNKANTTKRKPRFQTPSSHPSGACTWGECF